MSHPDTKAEVPPQSSEVLPEKKRYGGLLVSKRRGITMHENASKPILKVWMKRLAIWAAQQYRMPTIRAMKAEARRITNFPVLHRTIVDLRKNPAWQAYYEEVSNDIALQAKAHAEEQSLEATQAHFEAIQALKANKEWKELSKFTNPVLDRVWPKQAESGPAQAPLIQINLGTAKSEIQEAEIVSIEEVPLEGP